MAYINKLFLSIKYETDCELQSKLYLFYLLFSLAVHKIFKNSNYFLNIISPLKFIKYSKILIIFLDIMTRLHGCWSPCTN